MTAPEKFVSRWARLKRAADPKIQAGADVESPSRMLKK
jgi:hypothetical protein